MAALLLVAGTAAAAMAGDEARAVVERLADAVETNYVDPARARRIARELRRGRWHTAGDTAAMLAGKLTDALQAHDRHFSVTVAAETAVDASAAVDLEAASRWRNYGFRRVEVLRGNVGYIDLRTFADVSAAAPTAAAAMALVAEAGALILDLRYNGGGDPAMVQFLSSYFFAGDVHLNSFYSRPRDETRQSWTLPAVPGRKRPDVPLYVLTSARTGSAAEELAYTMRVLERAVLIGRTTAGAANPAQRFELGGGWRVFISTGRVINPVTGGNWEGRGVEPHIDVSASEAFDRAYALALSRMREQTVAAPRAKELDWALAYLAARAGGGEAAPELTGRYGSRRVLIDGGRLLYQRGEREPWLLHGPHDGAYYLAETDTIRLRFRRGAGGAVEALVEESIDGGERSFARR